MIVLKSTGRGNWMVGPGYARHIPSAGESSQADALVAAGIYDLKDCGSNNAAFDLIWSLHTNIGAFQDINVGGGVGGGFTSTDRAMLDSIATSGELGQALTSTVVLVNQQAEANKDEILEAIGEIDNGGNPASNDYTISLAIPAIPGTATGTATPAI